MFVHTRGKQEGMAKAEAKGSNLRRSYMFWLPLTAVLREGIETVIFLAGASGSYEVWGEEAVSSVFLSSTHLG